MLRSLRLLQQSGPVGEVDDAATVTRRSLAVMNQRVVGETARSTLTTVLLSDWTSHRRRASSKTACKRRLPPVSPPFPDVRDVRYAPRADGRMRMFACQTLYPAPACPARLSCAHLAASTAVRSLSDTMPAGQRSRDDCGRTMACPLACARL